MGSNRAGWQASSPLTVTVGCVMGWILLVIGYGLILAVITKDIIKARKVYRFQYVSLGRWTVRQPNGRFMRNLANVWDIATLGSRL